MPATAPCTVCMNITRDDHQHHSDTLDVVQNTSDLDTSVTDGHKYGDSEVQNDENKAMKMSRRKRVWLFLCLRLQLSCIEACSSRQQTPPEPAGEDKNIHILDVFSRQVR